MSVPNGKTFMRHLDGDTSHNRSENLQGVSEPINSDATCFNDQTQKALPDLSQADDEARPLTVITSAGVQYLLPFWRSHLKRNTRG
jgi:hypothetical protein